MNKIRWFGWLRVSQSAWGRGGDEDSSANKCGDGEHSGGGGRGRGMRGRGQDLRDGVGMGVISVPLQVSSP